MHVIRLNGARYLWDESTKKLSVEGEFVAFAANAERARAYAAAREGASIDGDPVDSSVHPAPAVLPIGAC